MALTFLQYRQHFQAWLNDTSAAFVTKINEMINSAYQSMLVVMPTHWVEKVGEVNLATNATRVALATDCFRVNWVDYPVGSTYTHKPTLVTSEDWNSYRLPVDATDQPLMFGAFGYTVTTTGADKQMLLRNFPACATAFSGTHRYGYNALPGNMSADTDVPVFDERVQGILLDYCRSAAFLYDKNPEAAAQTRQMADQRFAAAIGKEDSATKKEK